MTCSRAQLTATRPGFEPGTPWSVVRDANHCASPPFLPSHCLNWCAGKDPMAVSFEKDYHNKQIVSLEEE